MTSEEAEDFIRILSTQLGEVKELASTTQLREAVWESISTLPDGGLKEELTSNFDAHFRKLKRSLKISSIKSVLKKRQQQKEPSGNHPPQQPHECTVLNILTPTGLEDALSVLRELTECSAKLKMYEKLVAATHDTDFLTVVLEKWSNEVEMFSIEECLAGIRFCSLVTGSSFQSSVPWLQFCFRVYTALVDRVLSSDDGHKTDHVEAINAAILSTLMQAHLRRGYFPQEGSTYEDSIAALLSLYIDLLVAATPTATPTLTFKITILSTLLCLPHLVQELNAQLSKTETMVTKDSSYGGCGPDHLLSVVLTLLGYSQEHCLDAVLQLASPPSHISAHLLLPLVRKLLDLSSRLNPLSPSHYIKCVCCFHWAASLLVMSREAVTRHNKLSFQVPAPGDIKEWLWQQNPSVCRYLGLKHSWSQEKTVNYLVKRLANEKAEALLDVASVSVIHSADRHGNDDSDHGSHCSDLPQQSLFFEDHTGENDEVLEYDSDKTSENWLENVIGELQFDSAMEEDADEKNECLADGSEEEISKLDVVERFSQTKKPRYSTKEPFGTFSICDIPDQELDSVGVRQVAAESTKLPKPDVWRSFDEGIALDPDVTTDDDVSRGYSIKATDTSQESLVCHQVKRRTSRVHARERSLKRVSPVVLRRSTRKKVASNDDNSVTLITPSTHLPSSPKLQMQEPASTAKKRRKLRDRETS